MNQSTIKRLEDNPDLYAFDKVNILLVADGKKPAGKLEVFSEKWKQDEPAKSIDKTVLHEIQTILRELDLHWLVDVQVHDVQADSLIEQTDIFITREQETLDVLIAANKAGDTLVLGDLYGYPATAIQAFLNDDLLPIEEMPASIDGITDEQLAFLQHRLSRDNWRDEVRYLPEYAARLKQLSPKIYAEHLNRS
jgi:hypothetical protein